MAEVYCSSRASRAKVKDMIQYTQQTALMVRVLLKAGDLSTYQCRATKMQQASRPMMIQIQK